MVANKSFLFKEIPAFAPEAGKTVATESREFDLNQDAPANGAIVKGLYFSLDPSFRFRMHGPEVKSYAPGFKLDEPFAGYAIVQILKSNHAKVTVGDVVFGRFEVAEYSVATADTLDLSITRKIDNSFRVPLSNFLGILGTTGLAAYASLYEIGKPKKGETIFISSAAGAIGQIVGQIAKHEGLKVIGSVGDDTKLDFILKELGFDGGWNYKKEKTHEALKRLAPEGLDIYYENVGGEQLEAAIDNMKPYGRIIGCGMISQYNLPPDQKYGVKNLMSLVAKRVTFQGFIVGDPGFGPKYYNERNEKIGAWLAEGSIKSKEHIVDGMDKAPEALVAMLEGKSLGKTIVKVADPE